MKQGWKGEEMILCAERSIQSENSRVKRVKPGEIFNAVSQTASYAISKLCLEI